MPGIIRILLAILLTLNVTSSAQNLFNNPESIVYDHAHNRYLVSNWADGKIIQVDSSGNASYFYETLGGNVAGLHIKDGILYAAANNGPNAGLAKFDLAEDDLIEIIFVPGMQLLNGIATDTSGFLYVTDYNADVIFKVDLSDNSVSTFVWSGLSYPNGAEFDEKNNRLLVLNGPVEGNPIVAVNLQDSTISDVVAVGFMGDGLTKDQFGNYFLSTWSPTAIYAYDSTFTNPPEMIYTYDCGPADICCNPYAYTIALPCFNQSKVDFICPYVGIAADTTWAYPPLEVQFTGSSMLTVDSWSWDFGDGDTANGQTPDHVFGEPGIYDITLGITVDTHYISTVENEFIVILADTLSAGPAQGDPGGTAELIITADNTVPVSHFTVPVEYNGPLGLTLDSISTAGCRTEYFDNMSIIDQDVVQRRAAFRINNFSTSGTPELEPGSGPILKVYFTISPSAVHGFPNPIIIDGYNSYLPKFQGPILSFNPISVDAEITLSGICGDINSDEAINILDVTFLIAYLYMGGQAPNPVDSADINSDGNVNILDIVYLIDYLYNGGPDPVCL